MVGQDLGLLNGGADLEYQVERVGVEQWNDGGLGGESWLRDEWTLLISAWPQTGWQEE